ncbi:Toprim domain-containing protein [Mucilaginibacter gracilis]|uniref:Toprim domain-containing protein n=1 Tax=Mucilaginibacter gracilis TaxID=423350 RepID=A0A495J6A6_9SPHI|nr:toprim domain-containing protein [Mucilaginibacter gracilis]RKR84407.1 Toprim domain-containing protein [Mucilaginibacter gracilis]
MGKLTCDTAKQIDLVDYLASLGYQPQKISRQDYWYLSPLREENDASFKVNRKLNVWYDHAMGKGGDLIDFGTRYFKCTIGDLLQRLSDHSMVFSFHPPLSGAAIAGEKKETDAESRIVILGTRPLAGEPLLTYLDQRYISLAAARPHCREVDFLLYNKQYTVIGFQNNAGGYELRSANFKGSSSPKDITFIDNGSKRLAVFEGFFSYLSFREMQKGRSLNLPNFLVLNSLSFFEKSRSLMEQHTKVNLYLDRDQAGIKCTAQAIEWNGKQYKDQSGLYAGHKDLNDWLKSQKRQQPKQRLKPRF